MDVTSGTSFTLTLSATDQAAINQILNKNGTSSTGGTDASDLRDGGSAGGDAATVEPEAGADAPNPNGDGAPDDCNPIPPVEAMRQLERRPA